MLQSSEVILATLPGSTDRERIIMVLRQREHLANFVEMRQQSWCEEFGWYTQSSIEMEPQQVAALRNSLGQTASAAGLDRRLPRQPRTGGFQPRIVRADSA